MLAGSRQHRPHPLLREALAGSWRDLPVSDPVRRDSEAFEARRDEYLARRPVWSQTDLPAPWDEARALFA